jgi:N-methylhydantoinase A
MLAADQSYDFQMPVLKNLDELSAEELAQKETALERQAESTLGQSGFELARIEFRRSVDCRYLAQAESLAVDLPEEATGAEWLAALQAAFEAEHHRHWNFIDRARPITVMNLRLRAVARNRSAVGRAEERASGAPQPRRRRAVFLAADSVTLPVYARDDLRFGHRVEGPGLIEEASSSLIFPAGRRVAVDREGNLVVELAG